jgi:hypothetical protein
MGGTYPQPATTGRSFSLPICSFGGMVRRRRHRTRGRWRCQAGHRTCRVGVMVEHPLQGTSYLCRSLAQVYAKFQRCAGMQASDSIGCASVAV